MARVVHFEVHADNPERAIHFYQSCFGWQFQKWEGGAEDYWLIITGPDDKPGINGGLLRRNLKVQGQGVTAFVCTLDVESIDDAIRKVESLGGLTVMPRMAVPGIGWYAYFRDTEGNLFGCMQADRNAK